MTPWRDLRALTPAQDDWRWGKAEQIRTARDLELPNIELWRSAACAAHAGNGGAPDPGCQQCGARLRSYQRVGVMWLYLVKRGLLGDPTGTGKTLIILALLAALREAGELGCEPGRHRAVVLTTAAAVPQWLGECRRFIPHGLRPVAMAGDTLAQRARKYADPWDVLFISPETVRLRQIKRSNGTSRAGDLEIIEQFRPGIIVYDDVDAMRHYDNKTAYAIGRLCERADRVYGVHATPLQKRLTELWSFLVPVGGAQVLGPLPVFEHRFVRYETDYRERRDRHGHVMEHQQVRREAGVRNGPQLKRLVAPMVLRRSVDQIEDLELPELQSQIVWLTPTPAQRTRYEEVRQGVIRKIREEGETVTRAAAMAQFMHAWQVCSGLATLDGETRGDSVKLSWLMDRLTGDFAENKVVGFINFKPNIVDMSQRLAAEQIGHVLIWGNEGSPKVRQERLARFRDDPQCRVLLGTTSIERSLNLQAANRMVAVDTILNPARMTQIAGRVRRAGSRHHTVWFTQLLLRGTMEEAFPALLQREQAVADYMWGESSELFEALTPFQLLQLISGDPALIAAAR